MLEMHKKTLIVLIGFLLLLLMSANTISAAETYFDISFDRCVSIEPVAGKKRISDIGDSVTLKAKGRLWLTGNETKESLTEIVCQNLSAEPVNVSLTSKESPWVSIVKPAQCNDWNKNILICPVGEIAKGVFCKVNERTVVDPEDGSKELASAAINVRAIYFRQDKDEATDEFKYLQDRINYYASGIDLCYSMYDRSGNIVINWVIYDGGVVDKVAVDPQTPENYMEVAKCIAEQIPSWKFPDWKKDSQISYQF